MSPQPAVWVRMAIFPRDDQQTSNAFRLLDKLKDVPEIEIEEVVTTYGLGSPWKDFQ